MVDLDTRLRAFVTVAEELNFTRAAERLVLAQQALSAQVRQLETRLGVRLFEQRVRCGSWVEGGDPVARAFWSLEEHRGGRPLRTGTRVNSFEEAFGAVAAGLAITCQAESAVRAVGAGFPQLRFVRLVGARPAHVAVAWRTAHETELAREFVRIALEVGAPD
jgi:DNA-binding transcriptional LysR family regulator